jgi:hypothetical protein
VAHRKEDHRVKEAVQENDQFLVVVLVQKDATLKIVSNENSK